MQAPAGLYVGKLVKIIVPGDDQRVSFKIEVFMIVILNSSTLDVQSCRCHSAPHVPLNAAATVPHFRALTLHGALGGHGRERLSKVRGGI
jgi:hypothetical protein